jgi:hypothetical protein
LDNYYFPNEAGETENQYIEVGVQIEAHFITQVSGARRVSCFIHVSFTLCFRTAQQNRPIGLKMPLAKFGLRGGRPRLLPAFERATMETSKFQTLGIYYTKLVVRISLDENLSPQYPF